MDSTYHDLSSREGNWRSTGLHNLMKLSKDGGEVESGRRIRRQA